MAQDATDASVQCSKMERRQRSMSIEALHCEMAPGRRARKESARRALRSLLNALRLRKSASVDISRPDPSYKVAYLGNVVTGWAKGDGCVEKPLATLWRNYTQSSRGDVRMQLTVSGGGLRATTKDHGLTEYWAHRLTCCAAPAHFPRLFCWVYRHEGRRLRHELRCHAVLCSSAAVARQIETHLKNSLAQALAEFKRDKISRQNARLSLVNSVYENPTIPRRKILLSTGSHNYRPPLERSKSAPKLTMIEENLDEDDEYSEGMSKNGFGGSRILWQCDRKETVFNDKSKALRLRLSERSKPIMVLPRVPDDDDENKESIDFNIEDEDDKNPLILDHLQNDLVESCKEEVQQWFNSLGETPDLIPLDSDEGSLSSGCESASTVTSDLDQPYIPIPEVQEEEHSEPDKKKTEPDFKVGESVLARVCSLERLTNGKYCGLKVKHSLSNIGSEILDPDEVSLVPVGESQADFSSLKVFKKRLPETDMDFCTYDEQEGGSEDGSACSDESGYDELLDCNSSISNIVLV